jgi:CRP-like cAMP-binding protein
MKCALQSHPERNTIRLQLLRHPLLAALDQEAHAELLGLMLVHDGRRGDCLLEQGEPQLRQYFVLEGLLKRIVTSPEGRQMALRFCGEGDMETCYDAWQQGAVAAYSIVCAARTRAVSLTMGEWCGFLGRHLRAQQAFHERLVQLGAAIVDHTIALLLLDAPSRVQQFSHKHPELVDRLAQKDLASHLNLSAETLCRLSRRCRPAMRQPA